MKAYEFPMKITRKGKIVITEVLLKSLPKNEEFK